MNLYSAAKNSRIQMIVVVSELFAVRPDRKVTGYKF